MTSEISQRWVAAECFDHCQWNIFIQIFFILDWQAVLEWNYGSQIEPKK
jgi:hypothetical protein